MLLLTHPRKKIQNPSWHYEIVFPSLLLPPPPPTHTHNGLLNEKSFFLSLTVVVKSFIVVRGTDRFSKNPFSGNLTAGVNCRMGESPHPLPAAILQGSTLQIY